MVDDGKEPIERVQNGDGKNPQTGYSSILAYLFLAAAIVYY